MKDKSFFLPASNTKNKILATLDNHLTSPTKTALLNKEIVPIYFAASFFSS